jgi:hypothetical protein
MYRNFPKQTTNSVMKKSLALFMDIDGILHSTEASKIFETSKERENEQRRVALVRNQYFCGREDLLKLGPQKLLAEVLKKHPHVVIVVSSAWRTWAGIPHWEDPGDTWASQQVDSLAWVKSLLLPTIAERIVAKTPVLPEGAMKKSVFEITRLDEIRSFMKSSTDVLNLLPSWVAVDDQARHFPKAELCPFYETESGTWAGMPCEEAVVLVDGKTGLTAQSAAALDAAIEHASRWPDLVGQPRVDAAA